MNALRERYEYSFLTDWFSDRKIAQVNNYQHYHLMFKDKFLFYNHHSLFFHYSGTVVLFPCVYAFGCRQVVLRPDGTKVLFTKGDQLRKIVLRVTNDNKAYIVSFLYILFFLQTLKGIKKTMSFGLLLVKTYPT